MIAGQNLPGIIPERLNASYNFAAKQHYVIAKGALFYFAEQ